MSRSFEERIMGTGSIESAGIDLTRFLAIAITYGLIFLFMGLNEWLLQCEPRTRLLLQIPMVLSVALFMGVLCGVIFWPVWFIFLPAGLIFLYVEVRTLFALRGT